MFSTMLKNMHTPLMYGWVALMKVYALFRKSINNLQ